MKLTLQNDNCYWKKYKNHVYNMLHCKMAEFGLGLGGQGSCKQMEFLLPFFIASIIQTLLNPPPPPPQLLFSSLYIPQSPHSPLGLKTSLWSRTRCRQEIFTIT